MPKMLSTYQVSDEELILVAVEWPDEYADMIAHVAEVVRDTMHGHIVDLFSVRVEDSDEA